MSAGTRNSITDVVGLSIGQASDEAIKTGVTVLLGDEAMTAAVDVRGGGPGTRETDALALDTLVDAVNAIVLSGGSVYGLAAADAVARKLGAERRGFSLVDQPGVPVSPIVPAAILYDLANGGDKAWDDSPPYGRLAEEALAKASAEVNLGAVGAGTGAGAGARPGGLGTASYVVASGATVGAIVACNSFGSVYVPGTNQFWAAPYEIDQEFGGRGFPSRPSVHGMPPDTKMAAAAAGANTTIAIVATDLDLPPADLKRVAIMAQDGLARAIRPAHGPTDGDVVFAVSTRRQPLEVPSLLAVTEIGNAAGDVLARAVARGVYAAEA